MKKVSDRDLWQRIWQPIETAPRDGDWVWLWYHACVPFRAYWSDRNMVWRLEDDEVIKPRDAYQPTHWMRVLTPDDLAK